MKGKIKIEIDFDESIFDSKKQEELWNEADMESKKLFVYERLSDLINDVCMNNIEINE
jgi:hypothetical protein